MSTLHEQFEAACAQASRMYDAGMDTTEIDAEVDRLMVLLERPAFLSIPETELRADR